MARKPAFAKIHTALLLRHSRELKTLNELRVLEALILHYNHNTYQCNPAILTLAEELGISEKTVRTCIKSLVAKGFITVIQGHSNSYILGWKCWSKVPGFATK